MLNEFKKHSIANERRIFMKTIKHNAAAAAADSHFYVWVYDININRWHSRPNRGPHRWFYDCVVTRHHRRAIAQRFRLFGITGSISSSSWSSHLTKISAINHNHREIEEISKRFVQMKIFSHSVFIPNEVIFLTILHAAAAVILWMIDSKKGKCIKHSGIMMMVVAFRSILVNNNNAAIHNWNLTTPADDGFRISRLF